MTNPSVVVLISAEMICEPMSRQHSGRLVKAAADFVFVRHDAVIDRPRRGVVPTLDQNLAGRVIP